MHNVSMLQDKVAELILDRRREVVAPIADDHYIELGNESTYTARPMVLLLGNHSSGKSSLINHLLGQRIQRTGVAPTDDGFTILLHGETETTHDGHTMTTNPRLPLEDLKSFGHGMVQHLQGRRVPSELLKHVWMVDSPGMIDSGASMAQRPYDFPAVIRWFAERADLILLFFDPEKPGTTGETLTILTESLVGIDDKLRVVMNKMDLFDGIRDFARTYGSLCWNLSRALPTKDLPHIYTTVIPELVRPEPALPLEGFAAALLELEQHVSRLPQQRKDVLVSRFMQECQNVHMRVSVTEVLRRRVRRVRSWYACCWGVVSLALLGIGWLTLSWGTPDTALWGLAWIGGGLLWTILSLYFAGTVARIAEHHLRQRIDLLFRELYRTVLTLRDQADDLQYTWSNVRPGLVRTLQSMGLSNLKRVSQRRLRALRRIYEEELPTLR